MSAFPVGVTLTPIRGWRQRPPAVWGWLASAAVLVAGGLRAFEAAPAPVAEQDWHLVAVPDSWKKPPTGKLAPQEGFAWFRCVVAVPAAWKGRSLQLFVEPVDDARAIYFNGVQVGAAGTFPPRYRSGLGEPMKHAVPAEHVRFGEPNVVAVRIHARDGRTNFSVAGPVLLAGAEAIRMEGSWQYRPGDEPGWAMPGLDEIEALSKSSGSGPATPTLPRSVAGGGSASGPVAKAGGGSSLGPWFAKVDAVDDVERYVRRRAGDHDPLAPGEAAKRFQVPADLEIQTVLAEPVVRQPLFLDFDERGRLWVVQYLQYPNPAGLTMVSRDKHLRTVYDRVPPPPPHHFRGADKITIHEDTDGDGTFDSHKTFIEGLNIVSSFARGRGGVWVLNPPYFLFYRDADGNDVPDGDPEVLLEGFGLEDTHSVVNSLRWGPDGWLYAAQGSTVTGAVRRPGQKEAVHSMGQAIWRYHPETRQYEIFAEGGGNTFGVEIDAKGRIYSGHNGGDTRGFHYVQGGYYRKGFDKHGALSNPYAFGYFPPMKHHSVPRFSHNFLLYEGGTLPAEYHGKLFGVEPLQGQVVMSAVSPDGSTYATRDLDRPVRTDDQWFRPVDIKTGPDGAIYICDFYEQRIDHSSHFAGRIDASNGRIHRLGAKGVSPPARFDHAQRSSLELVDLLGHENKWHRQMALRLLGDRKDRSVVPRLREILAQETGQLALEALWAIHQVGGLTEPIARELLRHPEPDVRAWTVRLVCDSGAVSSPFALDLIELARKETYVQTRSALASSARRLPAQDALPIVRALLAHDEDLTDPHLPLLLWWAIEAKAGTDRDRVVALFEGNPFWSLPMVAGEITGRLMRRFAMAGSREELLACARLLALAPGPEPARRLMEGFEEAYQGRSLGVLPDELVSALRRVGGGSLLLRVRQKDAEAVDEALGKVADAQIDRVARLNLIRVLGEIDEPRRLPVLLDLAASRADDEVRIAALAALRSSAAGDVGTRVIGMWDQLSGGVLEAAQSLLASRRGWSAELLAAVEARRIDPASIPDSIVRRLLLHDDRQIAALVAKHWGPVEGATTDQMRRQIEHLAGVIRDSSGNPYPGKALYQQRCGKCHTLFGQGGQIGPDLTTFQRENLERMLLAVVNPSAEIREGFENYVVVTADGGVASGFLADQDSRIVVVRNVEGQNLVIARDQIEQMRAIPRSVMPDDVLKDLSEQAVRDLFAYLRSTQPLQ